MPRKYAPRHPRVTRACQICGATFKTLLGRVLDGAAKYCSKRCFGLSHRNQITVACATCGSSFTRPVAHRGTYCSPGCWYYAAKTAPNLQRFWAKVDKHGPVPSHAPELGPCWLWTGWLKRPPAQYRHPSNLRPLGLYGIWKPRNTLPALAVHRLSWELAYGAIPDGLWVLHRCDTPPCVNPEHLFLGTHDENRADMYAKGREARGERNGAARLTEDIVRAIRSRHAAGGISMAALARDVGVVPSAISQIVNRKSWRHVP